MRQVVLDLDQAFATVYSTIEPAVASETRGDDAAYNKAIAQYKAVLAALSAAKQSENLLNSALSQWQAGKLGAGMVRSAYACASDAMHGLSNSAGSMPAGGSLYAAAYAVQAELMALADGASCAPPEAGK